MKKKEMIDLVRRYFDGIDREDFAAVSATLADDCGLRPTPLDSV